MSTPTSLINRPSDRCPLELKQTCPQGSETAVVETAVVRAEHLSKRFGDLLAVDDLTFSLERGTVTGFLGPNGAGRFPLANDCAPTSALSGDGRCGHSTPWADARKEDLPQLSPHLRETRARAAHKSHGSRHLGHSSLKVTTDIYGHWERAERKIQAAKMEDAFPV
ncbi:MAG: hypothetical protein ACXVE0_15995 [Gaiellaceae bacterium]